VTRTLGLGALAGWTLWFLVSGESRSDLLVEDGPVETATAIAFIVAAVVGVVMIRRSAAARVYWAIPAFALVAALDELSFGARIFGFGSPTIGGVKVDSLHDVFDIADRFLGDIGIGRTMAAAGLLAVLLAGCVALAATGRLRPLLDWMGDHRPLWFVGAAVAMLGGAVVIDQISTSDITRFVEETLEFGAAIVTVLGALQIQDVRNREEVAA
jgi:hypothetical protein